MGVELLVDGGFLVESPAFAGGVFVFLGGHPVVHVGVAAFAAVAAFLLLSSADAHGGSVPEGGGGGKGFVWRLRRWRTRVVVSRH